MKKIILSLSTLALITTGAIANCDGFKNDNFKACDMMKKEHKGGFNYGMQRGGDISFVQALEDIELTNEQEIKIMEVTKEYKRAIEDTMDNYRYKHSLQSYFSEKGFDKERYIKEKASNKDIMKEEMTKIKANYYENIYNILDKNQKDKFLQQMK